MAASASVAGALGAAGQDVALAGVTVAVATLPLNAAADPQAQDATAGDPAAVAGDAADKATALAVDAAAAAVDAAAVALHPHAADKADLDEAGPLYEGNQGDGAEEDASMADCSVDVGDWGEGLDGEDMGADEARGMCQTKTLEQEASRTLSCR